MSICDLCQLSSPSGCTRLSNEHCLKEAFKLIKATATNGDVIKAICPMWIDYRDTDVELTINNKDWNAPYKANDTEESDAEFMCKVMSKTINKSTDDRNFIGGF